MGGEGGAGFAGSAVEDDLVGPVLAVAAGAFAAESLVDRDVAGDGRIVLGGTEEEQLPAIGTGRRVPTVASVESRVAGVDDAGAVRHAKAEVGLEAVGTDPTGKLCGQYDEKLPAGSRQTTSRCDSMQIESLGVSGKKG